MHSSSSHHHCPPVTKCPQTSFHSRRPARLLISPLMIASSNSWVRRGSSSGILHQLEQPDAAKNSVVVNVLPSPRSWASPSHCVNPRLGIRQIESLSKLGIRLWCNHCRRRGPVVPTQGSGSMTISWRTPLSTKEFLIICSFSGIALSEYLEGKLSENALSKSFEASGNSLAPSGEAEIGRTFGMLSRARGLHIRGQTSISR
jgi:hypothetical protein